MKKLILPLAILFLSFGIVNAQKNTVELLNSDDFRTKINGKQIDLYTLKNHNGLIAQITNYGGKVVSLWVPDRNNVLEDIVLGYPTINGFLTAKERYFGALIGRYANRIGNRRFNLNGKNYTLTANNGVNHLHGGSIGYDAVIWESEQIDEQTLELNYLSKDGEEGYPGTLTVKVIYKLTDANELKVEYWASTDQTTIVNLTHHSFFNLRGAGNGTINNHFLQINASYYTPIDEGLIPTGLIETVENTPFNFQKLTAIGKRLNEDNQQLKYGLGYDHNFVLNQNSCGFNFAAKVIEPVSGRVMEVYTNEPGLQFYGGNFLDGSIIGKNNKAYRYRAAFCLESQHFPDSPNKPHFPSTKLDPGEEYYSICVYKFSSVR